MATIKEVIPIDSTSISGIPINAVEAGYLGGASTTVTASHCVVADGSSNVGTINQLTATTLNATTINATTIDGANLTNATFASNSTFVSPILNTSVTGSAINTVTSDSILVDVDNRVPSSAIVKDYVDAKTVNNSDWSGTDLAVANGGTGRSSHTANQVIVGGTSATNPQASIAGGTSGYVLTSNGTTARPSWQSGTTGRFAYHQITSSSDVAVATTSSAPSVIGSTSVTIPTRGRITIFPDQIRFDTALNLITPILGLQIGTTEYYATWNDNGTPRHYPEFAIVGVNTIDEFYGTFGTSDRSNGSLSIETSGIPTGSQTVNLVVYNRQANTGAVVQGTTLTTKVTLIVEDFT